MLACAVTVDIVTDSEYPYAPDEFDIEADSVAVSGSHRMDDPFWKSNLKYIVIGAVALLAIILAFALLGQLGGKKGPEAPAPNASASSTAQPTTQPSESAAAETTEPAEEADKTTKVLVANGTATSGLAKRWEEDLRAKGWENISTNNGSRTDATVVYYRDEADKDTANALAKEIGAGEAQQSDDYKTPIVVHVAGEPGGQ